MRAPRPRKRPAIAPKSAWRILATLLATLTVVHRHFRRDRMDGIHIHCTRDLQRVRAGPKRLTLGEILLSLRVLTPS